MAKVEVKNLKNEKTKDLTLNAKVFGVEVNEVVLKKAIDLQLAATRQGTAKTKTVAEVSGGGRKPWRQKGTGRARQGSIRATQWRGGGIAGGVVPRDYTFKMNKKERSLALKSALTDKVKNKELIVVDEITVKEPKTKEMLKLLSDLELTDKKVLIVMSELTENVILASRNLQNVLIMEPYELNVLDIINADYLVMTSDAVKMVEEALK